MKKHKKKQKKQQQPTAKPETGAQTPAPASSGVPALPQSDATQDFRLDLEAIIRGTESPGNAPVPFHAFEPQEEAHEPAPSAADDAQELPAEAEATAVSPEEALFAEAPSVLEDAPVLSEDDADYLDLSLLTDADETVQLTDTASEDAFPELPGAAAAETVFDLPVLPLEEAAPELPERPAEETALNLPERPSADVAETPAETPLVMTLPQSIPAEDEAERTALPSKLELPQLPADKGETAAAAESFDPRLPLPEADRFATSRFLPLPELELPAEAPAKQDAAPKEPLPLVMRIPESQTPAQTAPEEAAPSRPEPESPAPFSVKADAAPTEDVEASVPADDPVATPEEDAALLAAIDALLAHDPFTVPAEEAPEAPRIKEESTETVPAAELTVPETPPAEDSMTEAPDTKPTVEAPIDLPEPESALEENAPADLPTPEAAPEAAPATEAAEAPKAPKKRRGLAALFHRRRDGDTPVKEASPAPAEKASALPAEDAAPAPEESVAPEKLSVGASIARPPVEEPPMPVEGPPAPADAAPAPEESAAPEELSVGASIARPPVDVPASAKTPPAPPAEEEDSEAALYAAIDAILSRNIFDEDPVAPEPPTPAEAPVSEEPDAKAPDDLSAAPAVPQDAGPEELPDFPVEAPKASTAEAAPDLTAQELSAQELFAPLTEEAPAAAAPETEPAAEVPAENAPTAPADAEPEALKPLSLLEQLMAIATPVELKNDRRAPVPELDATGPLPTVENASAPAAEPRVPLAEKEIPPTAEKASARHRLRPAKAKAEARETPRQSPADTRPQGEAAVKRSAPRPSARPAVEAAEAAAAVTAAAATPELRAPSGPRAARPQAEPQPAPPARPQAKPRRAGTEQAAPAVQPVAPKPARRRIARPQPPKDVTVLHPEEAYRKYTKDFGSLGTRLVLAVFLSVLSLFFTLYSGLQWSFLPALFGGGFTAYLLLALMGIGILISTNVWRGAFQSLLQREFDLDALLLLGALFTALDTFVAAYYNRTPLCIVVNVLLCFSLWGKYDEAVAKITGTRVLRTVRAPIGIVEVQDLMKGHRGIARAEGSVEEFMKHFDLRSRNDRIMSLYAPIAAALSLLLSIIISIGAKANFFWTSALLLLGTVPMGGFIGFSRAYFRLSRRLEESDVALCGWRGAELFGGNHSILVSDADIFPKGSLSINGFKIFYGNPDRIIAYAAAAIHASGGALDPLFQELLEAHNGRHYPVDRFRFYENGGIGAEINGDVVLVGTGEFMRRMGVHMDSGMRVQQAAYVSVGGELAGVFALRYSAPDSVARGLSAIGRNRHFKTTLVTRCFLGTPAFLKAKFGIPIGNISYPATKERLRLSDEKQQKADEQGALLAEDSFGAFAEAAAGGRSLHSCATAALLLALGAGVVSLVLMAVLAALGAYGTASAINFLLYLGVWAIPTLLLTGWAERY